MKPRDAVRAEQRLDALFAKINDLPDDPEIQSHWARYLCVLVSGYIETAVKAIFRHYAESKCDAKVLNFTEKSLGRFQNPHTERILELARNFSPDWENELSNLISDEIKQAINSIVANRHQIAHGSDVGLTYTRVKDYYNNVKRFIDKMAKIIQ